VRLSLDWLKLVKISSHEKKVSRLHWVSIAFILCANAGVFFSALTNGFVYDDIDQIVDNPWIKDISHIPDILFSQAWSFEGRSSNYYRPLAFLAYNVDYHLFGLDPWGWHLTNILMHASVSILVFLLAAFLIQRIDSRTADAAIELPGRVLVFPLLASLLFALHPINSEPVMWISSLSDIGFTLFFLLAFYTYVKERSGVNRLLSPLFFFFACLGKETALTLPIMLFAYDAIVRREVKLSVQGFLELLKRYAPFIVVAFVYLALRTNAVGEFAPVQMHQELGAYGHFINVFPLFAQYLGKLALPINLTVFYEFHAIASLLSFKGLVAVTVTLGYLTACIRLAQENRMLTFLLIWIAIPLLPVLYIPALGENPFAERYLYLPSVGFAILVSSISSLVFAKFRASHIAGPVMIGLIFLLAGVYAYGTVSRTPVWMSNITLWTDATRKSPNASTAHQNFAYALYRDNRFLEAIEKVKIAIRINPENAKAHYGLGATYALLHRIDEAIAEYKIATKLDPGNADMHFHLGQAYTQKGLWELSINEYQKTISVDDQYLDAYLAIGTAYQNTGNIDQAIFAFNKAILLNPYSADAYYNLGFAHMKKGMLDIAINEYSKAIQINPNHAFAHHKLGIAYGMKKAFSQAIAEFQTALRLYPRGAAINYDLAVTYLNMGNREQAIHWLQQTLRLQPGHSGAEQLLRLTSHPDSNMSSQMVSP